MTVAVEVRDRIEPLATEWESLARSTKVSPFLWPGWIEAWWSAFGSEELSILTAREGGRVTGVLPLARSRGALSSTTNSYTPLFGVLAADEATAGRLLHALFSQNPRRVELSHFSDADAGPSLLREAADAAGYRTFSESLTAPYLTIEGDWEAYVKGLRRQFRGDTRRRKRRLEEKGELALEVSDGAKGLDEALAEGFRIEGAGWKGKYHTSIDSHSSTRRFYTDIARWAAERDMLRLALLRLDGEAIAFDYCLEHNKIHYLLKTGYDPAYQEFSPGRVMRYMMLERAFSEGLETYDFLGTPDAWKMEWTHTMQERLSFNMFAPTPLGVAERAAFVSRKTALKGARRFARSKTVGERGRRLLKRSYESVSARLRR